jgi:malate dehydrogenase (oxaloacetate-decarboxylating)(NADP+)
LSLAYTPGVAFPCIEIHNNPEDVWKYTSKGNMVAVITDGTAVLGLGNIGPEASLPVMEGKCVLFKRFANIDAFPICLKNVDDIVNTVLKLLPSFGGINLEDIAAPACFEIEEKLKEKANIPIFHDDQHGTAIISLAGLINGLELADKKIEDIKVVFNGAGAAGIACAKFYMTAGVKKENIIMCDSKGVIHSGRDNLNEHKRFFAIDTEARTLTEAMKGTDVFIGISKGNLVTKDMVASMAEKPIVYALANPTPEIYPEDAFEAGAFIVATGRSDFPNQLNNVLGFPGIFRGALDTHSSEINEQMKIAASKALASLAKEPIPEDIRIFLEKAYPNDMELFTEDNPLKTKYIIPKPLDPRVVPRVARFVAEAAIKTGVARKPIADLDGYERHLKSSIATSGF